jgi:hypothetical protein
MDAQSLSEVIFVDNYNKTRLHCLQYKAPCEVLAIHAELYTFAGMTKLVIKKPKLSPNNFIKKIYLKLCYNYLCVGL